MLEYIGKYFINPNGPSDMTHFPLISSPTPLFLLTAVYLIFVLKLGPWLMRNREPMQLKRVILGYNILQIIMNSYMFLTGIFVLHLPPHYTIFCIGQLPETNRLYKLILVSHYLYFLNKVIDYMDTIFFVLRKSDKQITFLHVYHHVVMALTGYMVTHYYGTGGQHCFVGVINSLVHVLMYGYYTSSALQPAIKHTHWKQNITNIQMLQFLMALVHLVFMPSDCRYPKTLFYMNVIQCLIMIGLFSNFYIKTYLCKRPVTTTKFEPKDKEIKSS